VSETEVVRPFGFDPTEHDPGSWGASLLYNAELVMDVLMAAGGTSVTEVGALDGDLTRLLVLWAERADGRVWAVDPTPRPALEALADGHERLTLVREPSLTALAEIPLSDTIVLDGDHNHYTVSQELAIVADRARAEGRALPLVLLHDVGWPHGRRDDYFVPDRIPAKHRQPIAPEGAVHPDDPGIRPGALPYHHPAAREGGPGNGVRTAAEDFVAGHGELRLAVVPSFFGMGLIWSPAAGYADALAERLHGWDANAHLARLEHNRVLHLVNTQLQLSAIRAAQDRLAEQTVQLARQRRVLEGLLESRGFAAVERLLARRHGDPPFSRAAIRAALADPE
jgi:hypothetical protein